MLVALLAATTGLLLVVDVAALVIGLSIRRRVTRIVADTGAEIERQVRDGITEAVGSLTSIALAVIPPDDTARRSIVERAAKAFSG